MFKLEKTEEEVDDIVNRCGEQESKGGSKWPGMTYEQGVRAALDWIVGWSDDHPLDDE